MTAPYLGGFTITRIRYITQTELVITFTTTYGSSYVYQVYRGRQLCGVSNANTDRSVIALVPPADYPEPITLLAVERHERDTDYGSLLPKRPYNKSKFTVTTSGWPADSDRIEIAAGTTPGGAVDLSNIIEQMLFDTDRSYTLITRPLDGTGTWNFEVAGRDTTMIDGNRGTAAAVALDILSHPRDVTFQADGNRMSYSVAAQSLTVNYTLPA